MVASIGASLDGNLAVFPFDKILALAILLSVFVVIVRNLVK